VTGFAARAALPWPAAAPGRGRFPWPPRPAAGPA